MLLIEVAERQRLNMSTAVLWALLQEPGQVAPLLPHLRQWGTTADPHQFTAEFGLVWGERQLILPTSVRWLPEAATQQATIQITAVSPAPAFTIHIQLQVEPGFGRGSELVWAAQIGLDEALPGLPEAAIKLMVLLAAQQFGRRLKQQSRPETETNDQEPEVI